jgi:hypothetical protein
MEFMFSGTTNGQTSNGTESYIVTSSSGGIYDLNLTYASGSGNITEQFALDAKNDSVLSATVGGYTFTGAEASTEFDGVFALFGLQYTYGGALGVYTSSEYFHSTGSAEMTFGTASFSVTTYTANTLPETIDSCGISSTLTAYTLGVGMPPGTTIDFITYLHIAGTDNLSNSSFSDTFQLVYMTVASM